MITGSNVAKSNSAVLLRNETIYTYVTIHLTRASRTGADHILPVMHLCRAAPDTTQETKPDLENAAGNGPSAQAHVDYCGDHALMQVVKHAALRGLPDAHPLKAKLQTASRWAMFNAWKPVRTVQRDPLAMADCRSVPEADFRVKKREYAPGVFGGSYSLAHGRAEDTHRWYYLHEQTPEEVFFFRGYDSDQSTPGYRTPHTAFRVPGMFGSPFSIWRSFRVLTECENVIGTEHLPARESIECRFFVIWE